MVKPLSKGRQKIPMKKISDKTRLGVTFTKRRDGLFKKANELVTLCGAQLAILIFSPGNKAYSFGHPNFYEVFDRFFGYAKKPQDIHASSSNTSMVDYYKAKINALNAQLKQFETLVEIEKNIGKELKQHIKQCNTIAMIPRDQLTYPQMLKLREMFKELHLKISYVVEDRITNGNSNVLNMNLLAVKQE